MRIIKWIVDNYYKEQVIVEKKSIDDLADTLMDVTVKYIKNKVELEMLKINREVRTNENSIVFRQHLN